MDLKKQWSISWVSLVLFCFGSALPLWAKENSLPAKPRYAALFKNGIGLIVTKTELPERKGVYRITPLPDSILGTFWLSWGDGIRVDGIKASQTKIDKSIPASSLPEMLEANIGKKVELRIRNRKEWEEYTIVDVPRRHDEPILRPQPENMIPFPTPAERGDIVILQGEETKEIIPIHWVESIRMFPGEEVLNIHRPQLENVVEFTSVPTEGNSSQHVALTFLAKGIAWAPSYVVDISEKDHARITAKAVVINDLIPLENTEVELIAGYPHISFAESSSAFSLTPLPQILERIRSAGRQRESLVLGQQVVLSNVAFSGDARKQAPVPSGPATPVMGESAEDLYFYSIKNVTLKKGERGYFPLFQEEIPYEHVYTWDIPNYINENTAYRGGQENQRPPQVVWHSLKLTNTTQQPWTTAPAMTLNEGRILGQDTIHFTPSQASTDLKITQAVSVSAEQSEYEVKRQRSAAQFYNRNYDLVTVAGELKVTNYKSEPIQIEITKTVSGEITRHDGTPKVNRLAKGLRSVNPDSQIVWSLTVQPGKEHAATVTYAYQVYVRG